MNIRRQFYRYLISLAISAVSLGVYAQDTPGSPKYMAKMSSPQIMQEAQAGVVQQLIVEIDPGSTISDYDADRQAVKSKFHQRKSEAQASELAGIESEEKQAHALSKANFRAKLAARKKEVIADAVAAGAKIIKDYSDSPSVFLSVPGIDALTALLSNPAVRTVHLDEKLKLSANWRSSALESTCA